jgi:MFS family permease
LASLSSSYSLGVSAYLLCGIANALFFAASLAARVDYAPQESASQVFMWIAALKIAAVSIGSTFSGFIAGNAPSQALMVSFAITLGFTIVGYIHKRAS